MPNFSRTDLENAFLSPGTHPLLAEVHYKLCKKNAGYKTEVFLEEWEKSLLNRVNMNWKQTYLANPLKEKPYSEFSLVERVKLLDALCYWRLQDSTDIQNYLWQFAEDADTKTTSQDSEEDEDDEEYGTAVQPKPLGRDDSGRVYWYFEDECWIYREEWPQEPSYEYSYDVEYSCPEYVRLHINAVETKPVKVTAVSSDPKVDDIEPAVSSVLNQIVKSVEESKDSSDDHEMMDIATSSVEQEEESVEEEEEEPVEAPVTPRRSSRSRKPVIAPAIVDSPSEESSSSSEDDNDDNEIVCDECSKKFEMESLEPPLKSKPSEWKCLDCLVSDARGYPSRRRSNPRRSSTTVVTKPPPSPAKKRRITPSTPKRRSTRKKTTAVVVEKQSAKAIKNEEMEWNRKLLNNFMKFKKKREKEEDVRMDEFDEIENPGPSNWTVVSTMLSELQGLSASLANGSREQARLQTRIDMLSVDLEKSVKALERKRHHQLLIQALPRRQSSRVARASIRAMVHGTASDGEDNDKSYDFSGSENGENKRDLAADRAARANSRRAEQEWVQSQTPRTDVELGDWIDFESVTSDKNPFTFLCLVMTDQLLKDERAAPFSVPVNPKFDGCPDYFKVVKKPMDLGTVRKRVVTGFYQSWEGFLQDVRQIWSNCSLYNHRDTIIAHQALAMRDVFETMRFQAESHGAQDFRDAPTSDDDGESDSGRSSVSNEAGGLDSHHQSFVPSKPVVLNPDIVASAAPITSIQPLPQHVPVPEVSVAPVVAPLPQSDVVAASIVTNETLPGSSIAPAQSSEPSGYASSSDSSVSSLSSSSSSSSGGLSG